MKRGFLKVHTHPRCFLFSTRIWPIKESYMFDLICKSQFYIFVLNKDQTKQSNPHCTFIFVFFFLKRIKLLKVLYFKIMCDPDILSKNSPSLLIWGMWTELVRVTSSLLFVPISHLVLRFYQKHLITRRYHGTWINTNTLLPFIKL